MGHLAVIFALVLLYQLLQALYDGGHDFFSQAIGQHEALHKLVQVVAFPHHYVAPPVRANDH